MSEYELTDEWPPAPAWAHAVNRDHFSNAPEEEVGRHYQRPVQVGGVTATIFEFHARAEGDESAGKFTNTGGPGIALDVEEITPHNAESVAGALLAAADIYKRSQAGGQP